MTTTKDAYEASSALLDAVQHHIKQGWYLSQKVTKLREEMSEELGEGDTGDDSKDIEELEDLLCRADEELGAYREALEQIAKVELCAASIAAEALHGVAANINCAPSYLAGLEKIADTSRAALEQIANQTNTSLLARRVLAGFERPEEEPCDS
jgi:hypothetical protein